MKFCIAYWPSQWQAATTDETVIDLIFGVFTSREQAIKVVKENMTTKEWDKYSSQFVYEESGCRSVSSDTAYLIL